MLIICNSVSRHLSGWVQASTSISVLLGEMLIVIFTTLPFGAESTPVAKLTSWHTLLVLLCKKQHIVSSVLDIDHLWIVTVWFDCDNLSFVKSCL